jgi:arylsulfatase A-like enzyme
MNRNERRCRNFLRRCGIAAAIMALAGCVSGAEVETSNEPRTTRTLAPGDGKRPNILFAIADDWSWPHSDISPQDVRVVKTPTYDRLVREGVRFSHAYVSSPSCTPSRAAILTGQWHWRLKESASLWSTLQSKFRVYPDILEAAGYRIGAQGKGWGPGQLAPGGRSSNPAGPSYRTLAAFLDAKPKDAPFCFWFGSHDPHRGYRAGSGVRSGMNRDDVQVPPCLPDSPEVRSDLCDYYLEVQRFDRELGEMLDLLRERGLLDNTIVVMTGDNGLPFPRCKSNLYDGGVRVPLVVRWGTRIQPGRVVDDFVSLNDFAPTFIEAAGLPPETGMTGVSLRAQLLSHGSGRIDPARDYILVGKERHTRGQEKGNPGGYPCRAIRTHDFLYIRNFEPARWPAGHPDASLAFDGSAYRDVDDGPTKSYMLAHADDARVKRLYDLAFGKRPEDELYDIARDPGQLNSVASDPAYAAKRDELRARLMERLVASEDPRALGRGDVFDTYPYYGRGSKPKRVRNPAGR